MTDERLRLTAEMRDRLTPALRRLQTVLGATGRTEAFRKLAHDMSLAERAGYRFGFMLGRTLRTGAIAAAGATALASAAMVKLGKDAVDSLDDIKAFSGQVGFSADSLRILQGVADRFNVSQDSLRSGLQSFNARLGQLKSGQGAFLGFLNKTNPALAAQMKHVKSTQEGYLLLFDALTKISDPAKRAALAKAAGIGQESLRFLADGPEGLKKNIAEVKELLGILGPGAYDAADNFNDAMGDIRLALGGLSARLAVSVLPTLTPMLQDLSLWLAANRDRIASGFKQVVGDIATALQAFGKWIGSKDGGDALKAFWTDLKAIASALAEVAKAVNDVVQRFGGWKVVIGTIVALKAAKWSKDLVGGALPGGDDKGGPGWLGLLGLLRNLNPMLLLGSAAVMGSLWATKDIPKNIQIDPATGIPWNAPPGWTPPPADAPGPSHPLGNRDPLREQYLRTQIAALQPKLDQMKAEHDQWIAAGKDKTDPDRYARFADEYRKLGEAYAKLQDELAQRLEDDAAEVGRSIGEHAAESLYQRMMLLLGTGAGGGSGFQQAVYRAAGPAIGATRAAFGGKGMLDLIAAAEGTGNNYNTTLGYGRLTGGAVNLTGMTMDQIDALQTRMLRHPANRWNSSAVGRYQFVRKRLRELRKRYGVHGSALFTPDLQDALAKLSLAERGGSIASLRNEWEGLRRVPDNVLRDAMLRRDQRQKHRGGRMEGVATVDIRFPNGTPPGTRVAASGKGLFKKVNLDTGRAMAATPAPGGVY